jgi:hypothetical protein
MGIYLLLRVKIISFLHILIYIGKATKKGGENGNPLL